MSSRREFLKNSMLLSGGISLMDLFPQVLEKALSIDPDDNTTYLDAEHIVILMQENRSFDHCFGTLRGVRGLSDPRTIRLANDNPAWFQQNKEGKTYAPFRMKMFDSKSTWMGDLPHQRSDQVDAFNGGKFDKWLDSKRSRHPQGKDMPLTMGFYTRQDLPFHYAMADAFTICDQHFCSANTSTTPNRSYFWSGNIISQEGGWTKANIRNTDYTAGKQQWETMPELLEKNNISWKFYQNDVSTGGGYEGEERAWLSNFGCNVLEYFDRYNIKFNDRYVRNMRKQIDVLPEEIFKIKEKIRLNEVDEEALIKLKKDLVAKEKALSFAEEEISKWGRAEFGKLSREEQEMYYKAFTINDGDPDFRTLDEIVVNVNGSDKKVKVPKGDLLYQFREDVKSGELPAVSWLASPQNFSDHPSAPWYGAWYVSQIMEILTSNPEVWKRTIFIVTYDENDGYYDHIPPFIPPDARRPETGFCSEGINTEVEWVRKENELRQGISEKEAREAPIGLGYRVPMIIASPWSRGGNVCSQVFDHTSTLQFLERWASEKWNKDIRLTEMSLWRREICGDLTAAFQPFNSKETPLPYLNRDQTVSNIYKAQFKELPTGYQTYEQDEIDRIARNIQLAPWIKYHEEGVRTAYPIPYELYVNALLYPEEKEFEVRLEASEYLFGTEASGCPFTIYAGARYKNEQGGWDVNRMWSYAVKTGDQLSARFPLSSFIDNTYYLKVYGPNGFYREFKGNENDPALLIECKNEWHKSGDKRVTGNVQLIFTNEDSVKEIEIIDNAYKNKTIVKKLKPKEETLVTWNTQKSFGWYDFSIRLKGKTEFEQRFAGHIETGKVSFSDPLMGRVL